MSIIAGESYQEKESQLRVDITLKVNLIFFVTLIVTSFFTKDLQQVVLFFAGLGLGLNSLLSNSKIPLLQTISKFILVVILASVPLINYYFHQQKLIPSPIGLYWVLISVIAGFFIFKFKEFLLYIMTFLGILIGFYYLADLKVYSAKMYLEFLYQVVLFAFLFWGIKAYFQKKEQIYTKFHNILSVILHNSPDFTVLINPEGQIEYINNIYGHNRGQEFKGTNIYEFVPKDECEIYRENILKCIESKTTQEFELISRGPENKGGEHNIYLRAVPLIENQKVKNIIIIATDITLGRLKIKKEVEAQRMENLGLLAAGIAHDFNNILQGILLATSRLSKKIPKEYQNYLHEIKLFSIRGSDLVKSILSFSELPQKKEFEIINICTLTKETMSMVESAFVKKIELVSSFPENDLFIRGQKSQFRQIILNLLTNSIKATHEFGKISVEVSTQNRRNVIKISDSGIGIPQENIDKIFTPFFTTRYAGQGEGTGIGLAIVKRFVDDFDGKIMVEGGQGKETAFTLSFPVVDDYHLKEPGPNQTKKFDSPEVTKSVSRNIGKSLIVVDDEGRLLNFMQEDLEELGHKVKIFSDPLKAFNYTKDHLDQIDAVITDLSMPKMSGVQLINKLYDLKNDLTFILVTGFGDQINLEQMEAKKIKVLYKPYLVEELVESISA